MKYSFRIASLALAFGIAGAAQAAPVNVFVGTVASGNQVTTFEEVLGGATGTSYNNVLSIGNVSFAERFAGQSLTINGAFDVLSGPPTGPLTLAAGAPNANLVVVNFGTPGNQVIAGLGTGNPENGPLNGLTFGTGALAALFSTDQSELGFDIVGADGGAATISFFRRNGTLIDSLILSSLSNTSIAFRRDAGVLDIAGFSITNTDPGGIGYDNLRFTFTTGGGGTTPEPGSLALVGLALLGAYGVRRKLAA